MQPSCLSPNKSNNTAMDFTKSQETMIKETTFIYPMSF